MKRWAVLTSFSDRVLGKVCAEVSENRFLSEAVTASQEINKQSYKVSTVTARHQPLQPLKSLSYTAQPTALTNVHSPTSLPLTSVFLSLFITLLSHSLSLLVTLGPTCQQPPHHTKVGHVLVLCWCCLQQCKLEDVKQHHVKPERPKNLQSAQHST